MRLLHFLIPLILICVSGPVSAQALWRAGDETAWAAPGTALADWQGIETLETGFRGQYWLRMTTAVPSGGRENMPYAVSLRANHPVDVYWNGQLLGRNHVSASQVYERVDLNLPPDWLRESDALLAFRADSTALDDGEGLYITFRLVELPAATRRGMTLMAVDGAVGFLALFLALCFIGLWVSGRRSPEIILTVGVCVMASLILWLDDSDRTFRSPDQLIDELVRFVSALGLLVLTPAIFYFRLRLQSWPVWTGGLGMAVGASLIPLAGLEQDARSLLAMSLFLAVMAGLARTAPGWVRWSHLGAALFLAAAVLIRPDLLRFFLAALVVLMGASLLADVLAREILANRNLARMARLQLALVKRNIQPHFIMNSLTVANELQQTDSAAATCFVDAMAGEFRALANMVDQDTTTVREEIGLCRNHLIMMGCRLGREFSLDYVTEHADAPFPPGVLHTLVENAISHNRYKQEKVVFSLIETVEGSTRLFQLRVPRADVAGQSSMGTGSGTAYIEARLEEFAPGAWRFSSQADGDDWVSLIALPEVDR